jgi:hypothetical protein
VPPVTLTLYAGNRDALIDLAADLAWLTGRALAEFVLDQHCTLPHAPAAPSGLAAASRIDQAIGALIAHGYPPERADRELNAWAARCGVDRHSTANEILAKLTGSATERR